MAPSPRVLLTNDDGPPNAEYSPYVLGLYRHLKHLGWEVTVVLPSSQKSWIGKAHNIVAVAQGNYFYPMDDGTGEISPTSRPLKEGELAEWILLDGTPASCVNIALHNLYSEQIDLVISGPNLGHNTSAAFALSSGTIGAAMSSSLSKKRSIALSYGTIHPTPTAYLEQANELGCRIINHLWHNWGSDDYGLRPGEVDLYSVNIPLIEELTSESSLKVCWTRIWRNSYGRLFKHIVASNMPQDQTKIAAGPLAFEWAPDIQDDITNPSTSLPVGSDGWAVHKGWVSVTPLRATFGELQYADEVDVEKLVWQA